MILLADKTVYDTNRSRPIFIHDDGYDLDREQRLYKTDEEKYLLYEVYLKPIKVTAMTPMEAESWLKKKKRGKSVKHYSRKDVSFKESDLKGILW